MGRPQCHIPPVIVFGWSLISNTMFVMMRSYLDQRQCKVCFEFFGLGSVSQNEPNNVHIAPCGRDAWMDGWMDDR
jgi:hypothetical protein